MSGGGRRVRKGCLALSGFVGWFGLLNGALRGLHGMDAVGDKDGS